MKKTSFKGLGMALGAGHESALGVVFGNIGIGIGTAIGFSLSQRKKEENSNPDGGEE